VLVNSQASPNDDDRDGARGDRGYTCDGTGETTGDIGAMIPSALRDVDRRRPGMKPNSNRGSSERDFCIVGENDVATTEGEFMASRAPVVGSVLSLALRLRKRNSGVSQTQIPKKVAISPKEGAFTTAPPRYALCDT